MEVQQQIKELEDRITKLEQLFANGAPSKSSKQLSIREFVNQAEPATANDTTLVIAYYIEVIKGNDNFTIDALRSGLAEAKIPAPKNLSDVIAKNIKKGFVMPAQDSLPNNRSWVVTGTGEEYVNSMTRHDD